VSNIYKDYKDVFFPRILEDKTVTDVDKDKIKALLAKPFNPCKDLETSESGSNLYIYIFFENRSVKFSCFFGIVLEPQKWGDLLHDGFVHSCRTTNNLKDITPHGEDF